MHHTAHENSKLRSSKVLFCVVTFAMKMKKKMNQFHEIASPDKDLSRSDFHSVLWLITLQNHGIDGLQADRKAQIQSQWQCRPESAQGGACISQQDASWETRPAKVRDAAEIRGVTTFHLYTLENSQGKINSKFNPQVSKTNPLKQRFFLMTI